MPPPRYFGTLVLTACLVALFITSKRLGEWSFDNYRIPSLRYPHGQGQDITNATTWRGYEGNKPPLRPYDPLCDSFPDTSNVLVVVKTGATESYAKIPTQLMTTLRCVPDFLIFSDMKQNIAGFDVYDSLDTVLDKAKEGNPDFDLYRQQQACPIDQESCNVDSGKGSSRGWDLDKYKNIHIAEKTYKLRPSYDWYLFVDADTYVLWPNLVQWLRKLDPNAKQYIGSVSLINGFPFAHGGSGYLLSQAAMREFVGGHPGVANRFDMRMKDSCCGDYMLAIALNETIDLAVAQAEFEKRFRQTISGRTLVLKDIYEEFLAPKLLSKRLEWDNLSKDVYYIDPNGKYEAWLLDKSTEPKKGAEKDAYKSFEHCQKMCDKTKDCFQFSYHDSICAYHRAFLLGKPKKAEKGIWTSGWAIDKIHSWVEKEEHCDEPIWPKI